MHSSSGSVVRGPMTGAHHRAAISVFGATWILGIACSVALVRDGRGSDAPVSGPQVMLISGELLAARLVEVGDQGEIILEEASGRRQLSRDELVWWGQYADRASGTQLLLADGSLLVADVLAIEPENVVVVGRLWSETRIPRKVIQAILFQPPAESLARDQLILRARSELRQEDRLLLDNGDELSGQLVLPVRPEAGAFNPTRILWPVSGRQEPMEVPIDRVTMLLFATRPRPDNARTPVTMTGFQDGSRVLARQLTRSGNSIQVTLEEGLQLMTEPRAMPAGKPWESIVMLQPLHTQITYLSDLTPVGYKFIPFLTTDWPYHLDGSTAGGQLRSGGYVWAKGLGMHSSSRLAFDTGRAYRFLHGELAIDQRAGSQGSVVFRVYVQDSSGTWSSVYESPLVRGGDAPILMRIGVASAERIALIVDYADRTDQWDHADWLNVRLIR